MEVDKIWCLNKALEMTMASSQGGYSAQTPDVVLRSLYDKLKELYRDSHDIQ